ncbi:hypothetical protein [Natribacillus halophilus]|uniref:Uncharacterized protein n=1 Tax=Natribacillus halophilus TaxID=549003 RepID=A0A1G8JDF4_9BACI|nr:hypothetical protein [Natribacillus halophilus]SDI29142.1 hypothetical protein SAMN04488123_101167 [Natribacillus halophilus]
MSRHPGLSVILGTLMLLATGCFYPQENTDTGTSPSQNQPHGEQLQSVQTAVDEYQAEHGVPPIEDFEGDTNLYERYQVDFQALIPAYMQDVPASAYENGGDFYYTLIDVEEDPEVRVINANILHEAREFERDIREYMRANEFPPIDDMVGPGVFSLDYERLGYEEQPTVESPYHAMSLPLYLDENGDVIIDYSSDLNRLLQEGDPNIEDEEDIRPILTDEFAVAPVLSRPYTIEDGEPAFNDKRD